MDQKISNQQSKIINQKSKGALDGPSIHLKHDAGDVSRGRRDQEDGGVGELLRLAHASQGDF